VPQNGEVNEQFGVYKTVCCGAEIVNNPGATFPDCPKHPKLTTEWKPVIEADGVNSLSEFIRVEKRLQPTLIGPTGAALR
jgi:hypothetical protein